MSPEEYTNRTRDNKSTVNSVPNTKDLVEISDIADDNAMVLQEDDGGTGNLIRPRVGGN